LINPKHGDWKTHTKELIVKSQTEDSKKCSDMMLDSGGRAEGYVTRYVIGGQIQRYLWERLLSHFPSVIFSFFINIYPFFVEYLKAIRIKLQI
jgi:hypothetical protein